MIVRIERFLYKSLIAGTILYTGIPISANAQQNNTNKVTHLNTSLSTVILDAKKINSTTIELHFSDQKKMIIDFYGDNLFRVYEDTAGTPIHDPIAKPETKILVNNPRKNIAALNLVNNTNQIQISTTKITLTIDKKTSLFKAINKLSGKTAFEFAKNIQFNKGKVAVTLKENANEYFYGGGVQNGRFSHKGKVIAIENENSWTDGGVASPNPFYWSTNGYGVMWYTFAKGKYDFGAKNSHQVTLSHDMNYLDVFFMVDDKPVALLNDFYQLTGNPVLLPKFGFYEGHLNAYNRDYWTESKTGILFEDGKRYSESQKENGGIRESLNGEKNNYPFSARGVIDRYKAHDLPLGWILPNDGYGAGYGQTSTLDSNIANLKSLGEYARKNGVQIGLWTQSDLHPKDGVSALLQRDIIKEVKDAGVRVVKTDVAWVGAGYSFGLNGVADVGTIIPKYGNNARPFIISLDGWAGTQRYATIWSGDQTGGLWEYIRFHIPTYIGSGLSGQPNITSDMDGIFGGQNPTINIRDFQWKTFTPMQLNMDGWGSNEKYPYALGEPATSINRNYLKWKAELLPYSYSIAKDAVDGLPIIRATFFEDSNNYTLGKATQYQFLYGPNFLIAPIYQSTNADTEGNDIRNNIYLPKGDWIDYFTGQIYKGGRVINNYDAPIWKLPVFVKNGAIIPLNRPNNNVSEINPKERIIEFYPFGKSSFSLYDDDGTTEAYKEKKGATTLIQSNVLNSNVQLSIAPTKGDFNGFEKEKSTILKINTSAKPKKLTATVGNKNIAIKEVNSLTDLENQFNVFYYDGKPNWNNFSTKDSVFANKSIVRNPQILVRLSPIDITKSAIKVNISGFIFKVDQQETTQKGNLSLVKSFAVIDSNASAYTLKPTWKKQTNADYYEINFNGMLYSTIKDSSFLFEDLQPETNYNFKIRAVNKSGKTNWSTLTAKTKVNPLEFAIPNIFATTNVPNQEGNEISKMFDFDETDMWHTEWDKKAIPFTITMDLHTVNELDKIQYLPRSRGNGILTKGKIFYSLNKENWTESGDFNWKSNGEIKIFNFANHPTARYIKIEVSEGVGNFGSGRELYVFKVPGTESYLPGDINNDHQIDQNDLTSYRNYTGLKKGDGDFDGYISNGDINKNGGIDAYDISVVATQLDGGLEGVELTDALAGIIHIESDKKNYNKGDIVTIEVSGDTLKNVNAFSFALPYDQAKLEYLGIKKQNLADLDNLTYDRLHTNGQKILYPTFVNLGNQKTLNGSLSLFTIQFKAKENIAFDLKAENGILVNQALDQKTF